jgi:DNA invertase Pin-like site-specific DNA recombinase
MGDVRRTIGTLSEAEVRIFVLHALEGELDLTPTIGKVILQLLDVWAKAEKALRSERAAAQDVCGNYDWREQ